jgi:hypothetical protein
MTILGTSVGDCERRPDPAPGLFREIGMTPLKYRVRESKDGWRWEVYTADGRTIASGAETNDDTARTAARTFSVTRQTSGRTQPARCR